MLSTNLPGALLISVCRHLKSTRRFGSGTKMTKPNEYLLESWEVITQRLQLIAQTVERVIECRRMWRSVETIVAVGVTRR